MAWMIRPATAAGRGSYRRFYCQSSLEAQVEKDKRILKQLDELDVKIQREILEDIEKVKRMECEDRNSLNRMLTSCGVPKGKFRDKLIWGCNISAVFLAFGAVGTWHAKHERSKNLELSSNGSV
uniref:Uncharacterized protein n=1 Tax=Oryza punctata TaxID=4537 RepID=A0A0E0LG71_ORYPU